MYSVYTFYMDTSRLLQSCIPTLWLLCFLIGQFTRVLEKFWPFTIPTSLLRAPDLTLCQHLHKGMTLTGGSVVRNPPAVQELRVPSLGQEYPLEKEMATHSSILAQRIPWTGEPGGLQSKGLQRVRHEWSPLRTDICSHNVFFMLCIQKYSILELGGILPEFITTLQVKTTEALRVKGPSRGLLAPLLLLWGCPFHASPSRS